MAFIKLQFKPGVNRDQTDYSNEGGWYECDKIRFRSGYPEKIGGWTKLTTNTFIGTCRQMWNWVTTYSDNFLALGTNEKLYIEAGGYFNDITPLRAVDPTLSSPDTDNCVGTTSGSSVVTITLATAHDATTGNYVTISGVIGTIGGIAASAINGNFQITVTTATAFTIETGSTASSTTTGGGTAISIDFEINTGNAIATGGYGWGTGSWGRDAWGLGSTAPIILPQQDWWVENFDNDLVANIRNGPGYWWVRGALTDPATALATRAISLVDYAIAEGFDGNAVPSKIMQLLVSQQDKHLIAFGAVPFGSTDPDDFDPLLIRWADQDTPGDWTPSTTNSAGDLRVSRGSRIVRGFATRQEVLVFTDSHLFTLQFLGTTAVFGLQEYADNISIASSRAVAAAANVVYWMGQDKFYAYTGRVETLPCTLRNHVFTNFNYEQFEQVVCGTNEQWNEVWWFYPTADSDYNDAYVVYNHLERIWYYGTIERTAWLDSPIRRFPQGANTVGGTTTGVVYAHENGLDDDDLPIDSYITSSYFDLEDGDQFMLTRRLLPDVSFSGSTASEPAVDFTLFPKNFPGGPVYPDPADTQRTVESSIDQYTDQIFVRARARQVAIKIRSEDLGVQWQLGAPRLDARPDGRR